MYYCDVKIMTHRKYGIIYSDAVKLSMFHVILDKLF